MYKCLKYVIISPMQNLMNKSKKILFVTDLFPIKETEIKTPLTLHNFVSQWIKQGHQVDVIKPNFILNSFLRKKPFYNDGVYTYQDIKILNLNYFTPFLFNIAKKIPAEYDISSYDFIVAHMPSGIIFANKLAKMYNKPLICAVHSSDIEVLTNPVFKFYFKKKMEEAYKNAHKIACRSFVLQKKFSEIYPELAEKTFVAASGIDVSAKENSQFAAHSSQLTVLTCANLIKRKNIDKLIFAINDLKDFRLTVIGDGSELKFLKKIAGENVQFKGHLPHKEVLKEMQKSDIFILPSINETFGMVYLEAMACGCITICTKNDGIDGIIEDSQNGFLTEPNVEGIKSTLLRIKKLAENPENIYKIRENAYRTLKEFSFRNCAEKYLENTEL